MGVGDWTFITPGPAGAAPESGGGTEHLTETAPGVYRMEEEHPFARANRLVHECVCPVTGMLLDLEIYGGEPPGGVAAGLFRLHEDTREYEDDAVAASGPRWPVIGSLPYLRVGRDRLRRECILRVDLDTGDGTEPTSVLDGLAAARLLTDRDDFAPGDPPSFAAAAEVFVRRAKDEVPLSFRQAMRLLEYGPVAHYFAHRAAVPTFLSGLALLALAPPSGAGVLELCCGAGHFLRHLAGRRGLAAGTDVVFSKLFLADRYVCGDAAYVCCDISAAPVPLPDGRGRTVFCHDALYFLPEKLHVLREMKRLAGPGGTVLVGHAHNSAADHGDVAGTPLTPHEYLALFEEAGMHGPDLYDDAELADSALSHAKPRARSADELANVEAIAAVWPGGGGHWDHALTLPAAGTPAAAQPAAGRGLRCLETGLAAAPVRGGVSNRDLPHPRNRRRRAGGRRRGAGRPGPVRRGRPRRRTPRPAASLARCPRGLVMPSALFNPPSSPVRWAVVGCGWVARDHGGPGIVASSNGDLVAACDRDRAALERFLATVGNRDRHGAGSLRSQPHGAGSLTVAVPPGFDSIETMLREARPDAVYLATPNHAHRGPAEACAAAGVPVLCEKPLAQNLEDAAALVRAFADAGVPLAAAFDQRFHPAHVLLREMVAAGELGTVTHARVHYACWLPADWSPDGGEHDNWRTDRRRAGGGAAIDLAPHGLDLLAVTLDAEWETLSALTHTAVQDYTVDDGAVLCGRLTGGRYCGETLATLHVGYDTPDALPRRRLELVGTRASVVLENTTGQSPGGTFTRYDAVTGAATRVGFDTTADPFVRQAEAFAGCILSDEPFPFPAAEDLRRHALLLHALARANAERRAA